MKKNKKIAILSILSIFTLALILNISLVRNSDYLMPKEGQTFTVKEVGSDKAMLTKVNLNVPQMTKFADVVLVGHITQILELKGFSIIQRGSELEKKFNTLYPGKKIPQIAAIYYTFIVDEVISGKLEQTEIVISQTNFESKYEVGDSYILFLSKDSSSEYENTYRSCALEDGMFKYNKSDETVMSLSNNKFSAIYDKQKKDKLEKDIKKAAKDDTIELPFTKLEFNK